MSRNPFPRIFVVESDMGKIFLQALLHRSSVAEVGDFHFFFISFVLF